MKNPKKALATQEDPLVISLKKLSLKVDTDIRKMKTLLKACKKLKGLTATEEEKIALLPSQIKNWSKVNQGIKLAKEGFKNLGFNPFWVSFVRKYRVNNNISTL